MAGQRFWRPITSVSRLATPTPEEAAIGVANGHRLAPPCRAIDVSSWLQRLEDVVELRLRTAPSGRSGTSIPGQGTALVEGRTWRPRNLPAAALGVGDER
jgi:hypothetical protein